MDLENSADKPFCFFRPSPIECFCLVFGVFFSFYYSWILDDAFIYFRYIDNLLFLNRGLVYNPGEFVEGYSSPFWILFLVFLRATGITYWILIRVVGVISYCVFWALLVVANKRLSGDYQQPAVNIPLIYLTFSYSVLSYFSSGTETPFVLLCAGIYACFILFPESRILQVLVGLSPIVRHEMLLPFVLVIFWRYSAKKRIPWPMLLTCFVSLGGWVIFRIVYYADLLPNTFYLKDEWSIPQGFLYVLDTILPYFTIPFLLFFFLAFQILKKKEGAEAVFRNERLLMLAAAILYLLYVIKVGGDARHFRFLAFSFCLLVVSTGGLVEKLFGRGKYSGKYFYGIALTLAFAVFLCYPRQLLNHPVFRAKSFVHNQYLKITDSAVFRVNEELPSLFSEGDETELKERMKRWAQNVKTIDRVDVITTGTCYEGYQAYDKYVIIHFGLSDAYLARTKMPSDLPAHKFGLIPLANDLVQLRQRYGFSQGAFRRWVSAKEAPSWVERNLKTLEAIEGKVYNSHNFWQNIHLAIKPIGRVKP